MRSVDTLQTNISVLDGCLMPPAAAFHHYYSSFMELVVVIYLIE